MSSYKYENEYMYTDQYRCHYIAFQEEDGEEVEEACNCK